MPDLKAAEQLVAEVRAHCRANQNPKQVQRYARFFTEGYDAWGIDKDDPMWSTKKREWLERYSGLGRPGFIKAGELLIGGGKYEEAMLAIAFAAALGETSVSALARFFRAGISNWAETDVLAGQITAPLLERGAIEMEAFAGWRASKLKYQRRCVPVSMLGLLKTSTPVHRFLEFLRPLMMDPEKVVQQGVGWFLREAWKKEPAPVEAFLVQYKDTAPRVIFQYATEKMTPAQRDRFRRARRASTT
ncbi:MAG: DNA alkylation repair protein [Bryobacteraceae bacterium]